MESGILRDWISSAAYWSVPSGMTKVPFRMSITAGLSAKYPIWLRSGSFKNGVSKHWFCLFILEAVIAGTRLS